MFVAIVVLATGILTAGLLFGMIYYGMKNQRKLQKMESHLGSSSARLQERTDQLVDYLEQNREQQDQIVQRLQNLETIVTSEAWDAIQSGEDLSEQPYLLKDVEPEQPDPSEKVERMARRTK
ncbi:MAG: hypothetical protein U5K31_10530 [Balneolaceae bacterium]|nr:hypothetical protein [Balneolaceae bacterium]